MDSTLTRAEHIEFAKRMEEEHVRQNHRITELEKSMDQNTKLLVSVEKLALSMENMQKEQREQGSRLEKLESKDGEMWRDILKYCLTTVIGIIIGYILQQIGM